MSMNRAAKSKAADALWRGFWGGVDEATLWKRYTQTWEYQASLLSKTRHVFKRESTDQADEPIEAYLQVSAWVSKLAELSLAYQGVGETVPYNALAFLSSILDVLPRIMRFSRLARTCVRLNRAEKVAFFAAADTVRPFRNAWQEFYPPFPSDAVFDEVFLYALEKEALAKELFRALRDTGDGRHYLVDVPRLLTQGSREAYPALLELLNSTVGDDCYGYEAYKQRWVQEFPNEPLPYWLNLEQYRLSKEQAMKTNSYISTLKRAKTGVKYGVRC